MAHDTKNWPNSPYLPKSPFSEAFDRHFSISDEDRRLRALYDAATTLAEWELIQKDWRAGKYMRTTNGASPPLNSGERT